MKRIKRNFLTIQNAIIAGILFLSGIITSCNRYADEYGMPYAEFIIKGKVKSNETNQEIENIKVEIQAMTDTTNEAGEYQVSVLGAFPKNQNFDINFSDIDGVQNGEYQDLDTVVQFNNPEFTGGDGNWNEGETTKEFDVKLKHKR